MRQTDRAGRARCASRRSQAAAALLGAAALLLSGVACKDTSAPPGPPYLAIVADLSTLPGVVAPARITYRVRELSGTLAIDRRLRVTPNDTVILPVPPATYVVDLEGIPSSCQVRDGGQRAIVLSEADNTGLIRYSIQCRGLLNVEFATDGYDVDPEFIWRIRAATGFTTGAGVERTGIAGSNDTLVVDDLPAGAYTVQLAGVSPNCVVTSDGGARQRVAVDSTGGTTIAFRVRCAREAARPRILSLVSGYVLGSGAFTFRAVDPDGDIDGYVWDITDCEGNSVLPDKRERTRRGIRAGRAAGTDTLVVVGALEVGLPDAELAGRCTELRVFDFAANSSAIVIHRIGSATGRAPVVAALEARLVGTQFVQTTLSASDADGDLVGFFLAVRLRDGTLGTPDGVPDLGIMDPAGYLGSTVPNIPTNARLQWDDIYAVILWFIDASGNVVRVEDTDLLP